MGLDMGLDMGSRHGVGHRVKTWGLDIGHQHAGLAQTGQFRHCQRKQSVGNEVQRFGEYSESPQRTTEPSLRSATKLFVGPSGSPRHVLEFE